MLAASGCAGVSTAEVPTNGRETADWAPFKGRVRVSRTWGHPEGHAFPAVDFQARVGGSIRVYAAGPGTVFASVGDCPDTTPSGQNVECNGGNGNLVDIIHPDGRRSRYLHLLEGSVVVEPGDHVCRGCPIGRSGWSGNVVPPGPAGAHLHYEELIGYTLVPPGRMLAQRGSEQVSYPQRGRTWQEVAEGHAMLVNTDFPSLGPRPRGSCFGWSPTLVGTRGGDTIRGTQGHDVILGGGGNDTIQGLDGEDRVCGGDGDDILIGGGHPDHVDGGPGADTCYQGDLGGVEDNGAGSVSSCESPWYTLTVTSGGQVVTSQPDGISCPGDCTETYVTYTRVVLTVRPAAAGWAGCDTSSALSCSVSMSRDRTVRI
jgi:Ca2+-binding RTX toxin-like protein